ncbi:unnamed protein product [Coffea canephora]|uniref:Rx N-terminal domain-containing protein n=1 Tax=Coffea canephora TaxID=49390 RepID=A0A068UYM8_COFCA|nr:unnamed protein product [Coffea canephora]
MTVHIVSFVLNQLSVLLRDEAKLLGGLAQEIQLIMDELGHMKAFLKFAEAKEEDDPRLEEWVMQVQDVAYDVQDIVEELCSGLVAITDMGLLVEEAKLVGIDSPKQQLICQLLDGCSQLKVVSVLGMGGIGKTTLVKKVQEDANVKRQFEILAWATVSQTCYMEEFLKDLKEQGNLLLDLEGAELEEMPDEIFKLYHLKFLSLKHTRVKIIPKSIGRLRNLECLDLSFTAVSELPEEILHIRGLLHLVAYAFQQVTYKYDINGFKAPNNIGRLLSLEWLFYIEANDTSMMREIGELKQLRRLGITSLRRENGKELCSSLGRLSNLEQLYVQVSHKDEVIDLNYMNSSLSSSLENLQMLCLRGRLEKLIDDPLESLQHLPNLQTMDLNEAYQGEVLCFKAGSFLKLEQLNILALSGLRWLSVEAGAMPNLLELGLANLKFMEEFPRGIQHLTNLQSLYLCQPNEKLDAFLKNPFEDYQRISHIPEIFIWDDEVGLCRHPQFRQ